MANIHHVTTYLFCDRIVIYEVAYERDGYITQVRSIEADNLPKTVRKWLADKEGELQHSKVFNRDEIVYK